MNIQCSFLEKLRPYYSYDKQFVLFDRKLLKQEENRTCNLKVVDVHFHKEKRCGDSTRAMGKFNSTLSFILKARWAIARLTVFVGWTRFVSYLKKLFQFLPVMHNGRKLDHC